MKKEICECGYREEVHPIHISGKKVQEKGEIFLDWICQEFKPKKEICECGHVKSEHRNGEVFHIVGNAGVRISKCKKFKAKNHSPLVHKLEDKEPEESGSRIESGSDNHGSEKEFKDFLVKPNKPCPRCGEIATQSPCQNCGLSEPPRPIK